MFKKLSNNIKIMCFSLSRCYFIPVDLHLLEAPHAVQDVELLPAFGEVHLPVDEVRVPQVDERQVL